MKILIATATQPKSENNFQELCELLKNAAQESNLNIEKGILWTKGPGCSNLAFELIGNDEEAENFAKQICMALMPSKWTTTNDELPGIDTWIK